MKINQIPELYIEQYLLGELPENLMKEMDDLILKNPELNERINKIKSSNEEILSAYPAGPTANLIIEKRNSKTDVRLSGDMACGTSDRKASPRTASSFLGSFRNIIKSINNLSVRGYTLTIASSLAMVILIFFIMPGIRGINNIQTPYDSGVRIKGLDSKLLLYRKKGSEIEELKNLETARAGDILQVGYIAAGNYRHGVILSIDGRGTVTLHLPDSTVPGRELITNKMILLDKSYELDDSPSFERFIMILSAYPLNTSELVEKAKKLATGRDDAVNGLINAGKDTIEFSILIKKSIPGD